jgi:hypothetical protein
MPNFVTSLCVLQSHIHVMRVFVVIVWGTEANVDLHLPSFCLVHNERYMFCLFTNTGISHKTGY